MSLHIDHVRVPDSTRAPLLCLHGMNAGAWVYDRMLPFVAARGRSASALSFRGHPPNASLERIGHVSMAEYLEDASEVARTMDRPIVMGHSMGGLVALQLASLGLVRAAVLVSPAPPRGVSVLSLRVLLRMLRHVPALLLSRPLLPTRGDLDAMVLNRVPADERATSAARFIADSGRAARDMALGPIRVPPGSVSVPLLFVGSSDDRFIPLSVVRRVASRFDAPLHVADGHGHFLFAEPGWEVHAGVMTDWMDAIDAGIAP